ncbi:YbaN family protein [Metabacillus fastidiosus]|uniref:YbaN family protein n=1 Tax=Metabacillus fastidiosus TaxID=1458 RepID=A0ABU6NZS7_9BACI|nr:YbaN family protein [Metabacillus fastidiosus]MEC2077152.1 YbaN family protein [Metabacillus fastidiosus]MED4402627.1 YbaN family protein [Metabacillus fastidiosus]MED4461987.1 YbaN family protein [Metabacillus fastidiosus]
MTIKTIIKYLYITFGFIFVGIGLLGIVLPLLPATPFLMLASFCFMRGSKKFEIWLKESAMYKKYVVEFFHNKSMTLRQKITILLFADCMIAIPFIILDNIFIRIILIAVVAYKYYYFIYKIKTVKAYG